MKKITISFGLIFFLALSFGIVSAYTEVYVNPEENVVGTGESFSVGIKINSTEDVYGFDFLLSFNSDIIELPCDGDYSWFPQGDQKPLSESCIKEGNFLKQGGANTFLDIKINNSDGRVQFINLRIPPTGSSGEGILFKTNFSTKVVGESDLFLKEGQVLNTTGEEIAGVILTNGSVIVNNLPEVTNLQLLPSSPKTNEDLTGSYSYSDADGHAESGTEIRWYKNGNLQSSYNDQLILPSSATTKGEEWYFTVRPKDGLSFGQSKQSNTITIQNSPPVLNPIGNKQVDENSALEFSVSASDIDNDGLTYSVGNLPSGASFSGQQFSWTPDFTQNGTYQLEFNVTDGKASDIETITVTVNDINREPSIDWFSPADLILNFREGLNLIFKHLSSDPDNDALQYSWNLDTVEQATTQNWTYSIPDGVCGNKTIKLEISDGNAAVSKEWDVSIYLKGDVDKNGEVRILDLAAVGLAYRSQQGEDNWNKNADIYSYPKSDTKEGDGKIDIFDLAAVGLNYNREC